MSVLRTALAAFGIAASASSGSAFAQQQQAQGMLKVASSGEHVWVVIPSRQEGGMTGARIMHHAADMGPLGMRQAFEFSRPVVDLVATGDQLWVVFGPEQGSRQDPVFDVARSTVRRNAAVGTYYDEPLRSMALEPQVRASGWRGLAALPGAPAAAHAMAAGMVLERPTASAWVAVELPASVPADAWLVPWAVDGVPSAAFARIGEGVVTTWSRPAGTWMEQVWPIGSTQVHAVPGAKRPTMVRVDGERRELLSLSPSGAVVAHELHGGSDPWCVAGRGDRFVVFSLRGEELFMSVLALGGDLGTVAEPVREQARSTGLWLHMPLLGAVTVAVLLALFLLRSGPAAAGVLPAGWEPLPLPNRVIALVIDLAPGAALALWLTDANARDLLAMPAWTANASAAAVSSLMLVCGWAWSSIIEVIVGASPGKWLLGGRVVSSAPGSSWRAPWWRRAVRAALTLVVLFAPALAFLTMIHPALQGLPEQLTLTAVARRASAPLPPPPPVE